MCASCAPDVYDCSLMEQTKKPLFAAMRAIVIPAGLTIGSLMCADARSRDGKASVPSEARRTIERANAEWLDAMKSEDAAAIAKPFDDRSVFVSSTGESVTGRAAITMLMKERFAKEGHLVDGEIVQDGLTSVGSMIYEWGHVDLQLQRAGASPTTVKGRYMTVWSADTSGHWTILRNLSLPF